MQNARRQRRRARRRGKQDPATSAVKRRLAGPGPAELGRQGDDALRSRSYREAARRYRDAARLAPSEPALLWKARVMRLAPWLAGPLVRTRQLRIENRIGS